MVITLFGCDPTNSIVAVSDDTPEAQTADALTPEQIHKFAWPAGRNEFNRKVTAGEFGTIEPPPAELDENAFEKPLEISREDELIWVMYGTPSGPWITVELDREGQLRSVTARYGNL